MKNTSTVKTISKVLIPFSIPKKDSNFLKLLECYKEYRETMSEEKIQITFKEN